VPQKIVSQKINNVPKIDLRGKQLSICLNKTEAIVPGGVTQRKESSNIFDRVLKKVEEKNIQKRKATNEKKAENDKLDVTQVNDKYSFIEDISLEMSEAIKDLPLKENKTKLKTLDAICKIDLNNSDGFKKHKHTYSAAKYDSNCNSSNSTSNSNKVVTVNLFNSPKIAGLKKIEVKNFINMNSESNKIELTKTPVLKSRQISLFKKAVNEEQKQKSVKANSYEEKSVCEDKINVNEQKKKEIIHQANALMDILEKTENINVSHPNTISEPKKKQEVEGSVWTTISNFFNPFKCTNN